VSRIVPRERGGISTDELRYFTNYHPFFPILRRSKPADTVFAASPLLFWTVILIAARHDREDPSLLSSLTRPVKQLLWSVISEPPHPVPSLQAIAILCTWHLPATSMSTDITYLLAGILKSASMHVGLHKPDAMQEFSRTTFQLTPHVLTEVVKAWAGCYIATQRSACPQDAE
jgi:transcriptional regulatory protein LEU3